MIKFLTAALQAGFGLAAIGAAVFWSVHKEFIQSNIFEKMTPEQAFLAFLWASGISGVLLLFAILLSSSSKASQGKTITADNEGTAVDNSGFMNRFNIRKREKNKGDQ